MNTSIRLVHLADLHIGCMIHAQVQQRSSDPQPGRNLRETDIERATAAMADDIVNAVPDIPVVLVSGDVFHVPTPSPWAIRTAGALVKRLVEAHIIVVVVDGNHDASPNRLRNGSPLAYLRLLGAIVVNGRNTKVFQNWEEQEHPELNGVLAVTAIPFEAVRQKDFVGITPLPDLLNVLLVHGRVGDAPDRNTFRRTTPQLPTELLHQGWDYVALGDWHIHGKQPLIGVPAYYAGSLEALTFGEAAAYPPVANDAWATGGGLMIELVPGKIASVTTLPNRGRRPVLRLQDINASGIDGENLTASILARLANLPTEAMVELTIKEVSPQIHQFLDWPAIDAQRSTMRHCNLIWEWSAMQTTEDNIAHLPIEGQWQHFLGTFPDLTDFERQRFAQKGVTLMSAARDMRLARTLAEASDERMSTHA